MNNCTAISIIMLVLFGPCIILMWKMAIDAVIESYKQYKWEQNFKKVKK